MPFYAADHRGPRNSATHFIGVTTIAVSLLIPLSWLRIDAGGITVTGALVVTSVLLAYYLLLDIPLGLAMCALFGLALCATDPIAKAPLTTGLARVPCPLHWRLDRPALGPRLREHEAGSGGQPVPGLRRTDLTRCGGVLRAGLQASAVPVGAKARAEDARGGAQFRRPQRSVSSKVLARISSASSASGSRARYAVRSCSAGRQHSSCR